MKFTLIISTLLLTLSIATAASNIPAETMQHFSSHWLDDPNVSAEKSWIHPYEPNVVVSQITGNEWDLNSDGIVNMEDMAVLQKFNMTRTIKDLQKLKQHPVKKSDVMAIGARIYIYEILNGIKDMKLFKIVMHEAGFTGKLIEYTNNQYLRIKFEWQGETHHGWFDINWGTDATPGPIYKPANYAYEYTYKIYEN